MHPWRTPREQLDAAQSPDATPAELHLLAGSQFGFVRVAVADHPNTEEADLHAMLPGDLESNSDQELSQAIARNPRTRSDTLRALASLLAMHVAGKRSDRIAFRAGVELCRNPNAPLEALEELLERNRSSSEFRKVVARETAREDVLQSLSRDPSERVQRALRRRQGG